MKMVFMAVALLLPGCFGLTDAMIADADRYCTVTTKPNQRDPYRECMGNQYEEFKTGVGEVMDELARKPVSEQ